MVEGGSPGPGFLGRQQGREAAHIASLSMVLIVTSPRWDQAG